jgi:WD40 repeat protein
LLIPLIAVAAVSAQEPKPVPSTMPFEPQPASVVFSVSFSPDGKQIAIACEDKSVALHEWPMGTHVAQLKGHKARVWKAAWSPDGAMLASCSGDYFTPTEPGELKIWDLKTHTEETSLEGHKGIVYDVIFSPDGKTLYSASYDGTIKMWNVADFKEKSTLEGHEGPVRSLTFTPDGATLASTGFDGSVRFWDAQTGKHLRTFEKLHPVGVQCVAFTPCGRFMATTGAPAGGREAEYEVALSDVQSGKELFRVGRTLGPILSIHFSEDGRLLATGGGNYQLGSDVKVLEMASGKPRAILEGHKEWVEQVRFSPDGMALVSAGGFTQGAPGEVRLWLLSDLAGERGAERAPADPDELWKALAGDDTSAAYAAILRLIASPEVAVPLLADRLQPVARADAERIARLIADLDADDFKVRESAASDLAALGELATEALQRALDDPPSEEVRQRAEQILRSTSPISPVSGEPLRALRAIEVLEKIGTPEARQILQALAQGEPRARVTRDAASALERLGR